MERACTANVVQYFLRRLVYTLYRSSIFYVIHTVDQFLLATCHLIANALIIEKDDKIDAFVSVQDSCDSQTLLLKKGHETKISSGY